MGNEEPPLPARTEVRRWVRLVVVLRAPCSKCQTDRRRAREGYALVALMDAPPLREHTSAVGSCRAQRDNLRKD